MIRIITQEQWNEALEIERRLAEEFRPPVGGESPLDPRVEFFLVEVF